MCQMMLVTNSACVDPSNHHQRELSPEYYSDFISHTPCLRLMTCTGVSHCSVYLNCATLALFAKSCFAMQSCLSVCLPVDNLDCLPVYDCMLPPSRSYYCLSATCLDPQHELCLWICPAFGITDARYWFMPVWLVLWFNKAAHGSWRHCLLVTMLLVHCNVYK